MGEPGSILVTEVQASVWVEEVRVAPWVGKVMEGTPVGAGERTEKLTVPKGPHVASDGAPEHARTAKV
jgi:hypothetical protein